MPIDWVQVGIGSIVGAFITGFVSIVGTLVNRSTTIDTKRIDDRGQFTRDLMEQCERMFTEVGELRAAVSVTQRREITFIRLFANLGAEIRILNGYLSVHAMELKREPVDYGELQQQADSMLECLRRMQSLIDTEHEHLTQDLKTNEIKSPS